MIRAPLSASRRPAFALMPTSSAPDAPPATSSASASSGSDAREARQRRRRGEDGAGDGDRAAAVAVDRRPGDEEHRRDRAECDAEERDAERPLRDAGRALHIRQHRGPRAPEEPERDEREQRREPSRPRHRQSSFQPSGSSGCVHSARREPVLPAGRPRPLRPDALALGADRRGFVGGEAPDLDRGRELVLVLPLGLARLGRHPDVEDVVLRRDRVSAEHVRILQVDVPAEQRVLGVAHDPERVRATFREELDHLGRVPRTPGGDAWVRPALVQRHVAQPATVREHRHARRSVPIGMNVTTQLRRVLDHAQRVALDGTARRSSGSGA